MSKNEGRTDSIKLLHMNKRVFLKKRGYFILGAPGTGKTKVLEWLKSNGVHRDLLCDLDDFGYLKNGKWHVNPETFIDLIFAHFCVAGFCDNYKQLTELITPDRCLYVADEKLYLERMKKRVEHEPQLDIKTLSESRRSVSEWCLANKIKQSSFGRLTNFLLHENKSGNLVSCDYFETRAKLSFVSTVVKDEDN